MSGDGKELSRAQFLRGALGSGALLVGGPALLGACGSDDQQAATGRAHPPISKEPGDPRVLEWAGYEVKDLWRPYARRFPRSRPQFIFFTNDDEAIGKVRGGTRADIAHPGIGYTRDWVNLGFVQPWDTRLVRRFDELNPDLVKAGQIDGKQFHIPTDWGFESVLYRADRVEPAAQSWSLLYDKRYRGKIAWWDDLHNIVIWGYVEGVDDPWNMSDAELADATKALAEHKKVVRNMWTSQTDFEQDFKAGNVLIGYSWPASWVNMRKEGLDVRYMEPDEGWLVWVDGFVLLSDTSNYHHAHEYASAWASPETGIWLLTNYAYGSANAAIDSKELDQELVEVFRLDDPTVLKEPRSHLRRWIERRRDYNRAWAQVKAA